MIPPIPCQIPGILRQTRFDPGIIVFAVSGIFSPPPGVVVLFEDALAGRIAAGLLPLAHFPAGLENRAANAASLPSSLHGHLPVWQPQRNQIIQTNQRIKKKSNGNENIFVFIKWKEMKNHKGGASKLTIAIRQYSERCQLYKTTPPFLAPFSPPPTGGLH
jgi:hypothetical protein